MALTNRGTHVVSNLNITSEDVPTELMLHSNREGILIDDMVDNIHCSATPDDTFVKSFILFLLGTILALVS